MIYWTHHLFIIKQRPALILDVFPRVPDGSFRWNICPEGCFYSFSASFVWNNNISARVAGVCEQAHARITRESASKWACTVRCKFFISPFPERRKIPLAEKWERRDKCQSTKLAKRAVTSHVSFLVRAPPTRARHELLWRAIQAWTLNEIAEPAILPRSC